MPGIYVHLGSLLDFSSKFASYSAVSCESNIYSTQHIETDSEVTMEKIYITNHVLREENNATSMNDQSKSFFQTVWNRYIGGNFLRLTTFASKMNNPLSVTLVNDEIVMPEFIEKSCIQKEKSIDKHKNPLIKHISKILFENVQPFTFSIDPFIKNPKTLSDFEYCGNDFNKMEQQVTKQNNKDITVKNLIYNMDSNIMCKDKSTMESHSIANICEIENSNNINNSSLAINLQKCSDIDKNTSDKNSASNDIDINENTKSFFIVSHSDVPEFIKPVKKTPISTHLSVMCRNAWNSLTTRFYYRTNSEESEKSVRRSSYLLKRHRRRKAIAMGRDRSKERCQLRRSGVSQTRHRKERSRRDLDMIIEVDYEIYRKDEIQYYGIQNDHSLNDESDNLDDMDGYDVPDCALLVKRTSPVIFTSSNVTPTKLKSQISENQKTVKHPTRVRYVIDSSVESKDCNWKTSDTDESPSKSRLSSLSSIDSEDSFIVFENSDDELPKQETAKYSTRVHCTIDSLMKINENYNNEISDTHDNPFRSRLLSESSINSEDSFIIFKDIENESPKKQEVKKYPTKIHYIVDSLTKINNSYHKNSKMCNAQKDKLRSRLLSESSSADSEDSFIVFEGSDDESPKRETIEDSIEIYNLSDSLIKNNDHYEDYNNKRYIQEDAFQFPENSEDNEDSFCIVFNTELEDNCNLGYIKTSTPIFMQDNSIKDKLIIKNDKDSKESIVQTKKVSFAPTPIVHIMVTWNYAYRAARKGQWEEMARDNERFKGRINSIAAVLNPILTNKHRSKIWQERFVFQE